MDEPNRPSDMDCEHTLEDATGVAAGADAPSSSQTSPKDQAASPTKHKHADVHEVPKWRFSNNAKKSLGYSSAAAGTVVEGKTSEEIVARYVVPKTSSSIHERHEYANREIGRNTINEGGDEFTETFEMAGKVSIPRSPRNESNEVAPPNSHSSPDVDNGEAHIGNSAGDTMKEIKQLKSDTNVLKQDTEVLKQQQENQGGKLERLALAMNEQIPSLPVPPTRVDLDAGFSDAEPEAALDNDELDQLEKQEEERLESAIEPNNPLPHSKPDPPEGEDTASSEAEEEKKKFPWKKIVIISVPILIVVVVVLGVLLGSKDEGGESNKNPLPQEAEDSPVSSGKLQATFPPPAAPSATFPPTVAPSALPTAACTDSNEKLFSVSSTRNEQVDFLSSFGWAVKDVCTGEEVMKCLPCSSVVEDDGTVTVESTLPRGYKPATDEGVRYRFLEDVGDGVKQCVPDRKYMFQIKSPASEECCGFDPTSFVVYYDGEAVRTGHMNQAVAQQGSRQADNDSDKSSTSQAFTVETQTYFGGEDDDGPCPSATPSTSTAPTTTPSLPLVEFALPKGADPISDKPCQHVMEAEMIGRVAGLNCGFCGFCRWADSVFSCYQRTAYLKRQNGVGEIEGRQALCDQDQCIPPLEDTSESDLVWSEIEKSDRCELV